MAEEKPKVPTFCPTSVEEYLDFLRKTKIKCLKPKVQKTCHWHGWKEKFSTSTGLYVVPNMEVRFPDKRSFHLDLAHFSEYGWNFTYHLLHTHQYNLEKLKDTLEVYPFRASLLDKECFETTWYQTVGHVYDKGNDKVWFKNQDLLTELCRIQTQVCDEIAHVFKEKENLAKEKTANRKEFIKEAEASLTLTMGDKTLSEEGITDVLQAVRACESNISDFASWLHENKAWDKVDKLVKFIEAFYDLAEPPQSGQDDRKPSTHMLSEAMYFVFKEFLHQDREKLETIVRGAKAMGKSHWSFSGLANAQKRYKLLTEDEVTELARLFEARAILKA